MIVQVDNLKNLLLMGQSGISLPVNKPLIKSSYVQLVQMDWKCPDVITLELWEIAICRDLRNFNHTHKIKEIYIPEYNLSVNREYYCSNNFNIILDSYDRYHKENLNINDINFEINGSNKPILLKKIIFNKSTNQELIQELHDGFVGFVKSKGIQGSVNELFNLIST